MHSMRRHIPRDSHWVHAAQWGVLVHRREPSNIQLDYFESSLQEDSPGKVSLQGTKTQTLTTVCTLQPLLLRLDLVPSIEDALLRTVLFVYDTKLKRLECHRLDPDGCSILGTVLVNLGRIRYTYVLPGPRLIIISKSDRVDRIRGHDLFEWTLGQQIVLQGRIESEHIAGIMETGQGSWQLAYSQTGGKGPRVVLAPGSLLVNGKQEETTLAPSLNPYMVPEEYRHNMDLIVAWRNILEVNSAPTFSSSQGSFRHAWGQTRSGELVHFEDQVLKWSHPLKEQLVKMELTECKTREGFKQCLLACTECATYLYNAATGRQLAEWATAENSVVLSDIQKDAARSVLMIPQQDFSSSPILCDIYPVASPTMAMTSMECSEDNASRAAASLGVAVSSIERDIAAKRKQIERLQKALASKRDIAQNCHDILAGPLKDVFVADGSMGVNASGSQELDAFFQAKRAAYRKRVLARLTPLVGSTLAGSSLFEDEKDDVSGQGPTPAVAGLMVQVNECVSGWLTIHRRDLLWVGVRIHNRTSRDVLDIQLSVANQDCRGQAVARLKDESECLVAGIMEVDMLALDEGKCWDKTLSAQKLLSNKIMVHYRQGYAQGRSCHSEDSMRHMDVSVSKVAVLAHVAPEWRSILALTVLPWTIGCRFYKMPKERLQVLLQDGLGLSSGADGKTYGSLEEGILACVEEEDGEMDPSIFQETDSKETAAVVFRAESEIQAMRMAQQARMLGPRYL